MIARVGQLLTDICSYIVPGLGVGDSQRRGSLDDADRASRTSATDSTHYKKMYSVLYCERHVTLPEGLTCSDSAVSAAETMSPRHAHEWLIVNTQQHLEHHQVIPAVAPIKCFNV
jgi:hypothetical protein